MFFLSVVFFLICIWGVALAVLFVTGLIIFFLNTKVKLFDEFGLICLNGGLDEK